MEWEVATRWENDKRDQRKLSLPKKFIIKSLYHYTVYNRINSILSKDTEHMTICQIQKGGDKYKKQF